MEVPRHQRPLSLDMKSKVLAFPKVLVIEDDEEIRDLLLLQLKRQGFEGICLSSAEEGLTCLKNDSISLLIIDWMLPGMSGKDFVRIVRSFPQGLSIPILFLTAKASAEDIVSGLDAGADDYLTKPFDNGVLLARVRSLLRRTEWQSLSLSQKRQSEGNQNANSVYYLGPLMIDPDSFRVQLEDKELELTKSEFLLLESLIEHQGKVLTRNQLIQCVQGEGVAVVGRTVDTHVFGLRKKLGAFGDLIETVRGVGYRIGYWENT